MSKFIFENKERLPLARLDEQSVIDVMDAYIGGNDTVLSEFSFKDDAWLPIPIDDGLFKMGVYQVKEKPYTLDDALSDIDMLPMRGQEVEAVRVEMTRILRKFARLNGIKS